MTNSEICRLYEGLSELGSLNLKMKAKTTYNLVKNKMILEPLYKTINECKKQIWFEFGEETPQGFTIPNSKVDEANKAFEELSEVENNVVLNGIRLEDLPEDGIGFELLEKIISIIEEPQA